MRRLLYILPLLALACGVTTLPIVIETITPAPTVTTAAVVNPAPTATPDVRTVIAESLNVRHCPSTVCKGVDILYYGQGVTVLWITYDDWCRVQYTGVCAPGKTCYVACWWLK